MYNQINSKRAETAVHPSWLITYIVMCPTDCMVQYLSILNTAMIAKRALGLTLRIILLVFRHLPHALVHGLYHLTLPQSSHTYFMTSHTGSVHALVRNFIFDYSIHAVVYPLIHGL